MSTASKVADRKKKHPELYCPVPACLWLTHDGSRCPRHAVKPPVLQCGECLMVHAEMVQLADNGSCACCDRKHKVTA